MKRYFYIATALVALASCSSDEMVSDSPPTQKVNDGNAIVFSSSKSAVTRGDIIGSQAAVLLGNNFYVTGTKGTEAANSPTPTLVFDNYLVHYESNTADKTQSNTANWEYVGITPGSGSYTNHAKLSTVANEQTIKYWDYSADQYDFLAFSTGTYKAVTTTPAASGEVGVTTMKYGTSLASSGTAYTFTIPSVDALKQTYISDITEVPQANFGKEVQLQFKNLGSKVRIALYETVPGYSVKDVNFYTVDGSNDFTDASKSTTATLISANANGLPTKGTIAVYFPHVGNDNASAQDYNKAATTVTPVTASSTKSQQFGTLSNFATKESFEAVGSYLGRSLTTATYAGSAAAQYYTIVFPVSSSDPLTLRVDYTLVSTDGSAEEIHVYGAKAVVPATYTKWLPNYAYTYIFKITDNTNGWTSSTAAGSAGLFPITFDAVVAEATDANAEQKTITTVAAPTITTYQQGHDNNSNEYKKGEKNLYVQVMNNSAVPATLVTTLSATNSLLYAVSDADATEAEVMNTLENRTTALTETNVTGRNGITLTKNANISNTATKIVNGVDDNPITVASGSAAEITINSLAAGTYAYVYIPTASTSEVNQFEPVVLANDAAIAGTEGYYSIAKTAVATGTALTAAEAPDAAYIYFSATENGTATKTYSYISPLGKATIPAGCIKVAKSSLTAIESATTASDANFYFAKYITNNGSYAVKVIKVVA